MVPIDDVQCVALLVMARVAFARATNVWIAVNWHCACASTVDRMHLDSVTIDVEVFDANCHHYVFRASTIDSNWMMWSMIEHCHVCNVKWVERFVIVVIVMYEWWLDHINCDEDCRLMTVALVWNVIRALNCLIDMIRKMPSKYQYGHLDSMYCRMMFYVGLVCVVVYVLNQHNLMDCNRHVHMIVFVLKLKPNKHQ